MSSILERNKNLKKPEKKTYAEHAQDALYREVWEDVNNEKTQQFLKKYWRYIVGAAIGIMIVVCAIQIGTRIYHASKIATAQVYETAIANVDAGALANLAHDKGGATSDLALFQSYLIDKDIKKLEDLSQNGHTRDFKDLAKLHMATINGDKMDFRLCNLEEVTPEENRKRAKLLRVLRSIGRDPRKMGREELLTIFSKYTFEDPAKRMEYEMSHHMEF